MCGMQVELQDGLQSIRWHHFGSQNWRLISYELGVRMRPAQGEFAGGVNLHVERITAYVGLKTAL